MHVVCLVYTRCVVVLICRSYIVNTLTRLIDTTQNAVHSADNMRLHTSTHCMTPALLTPPLLLLLLLLLLLMVMMVMSVLTLAAAVMQQKNSGPEWFAFILC